MATKIQVRRDTAANWTSQNPTLSSGEIGYETDTNKVKIGDGSTAWNSISDYFEAGAGVSDHGGLTGRDDDDHTLYALADGTRAFSSTIDGVTPTSDAHLATKGYVDGLLQGLDWQDSVLDQDLTAPPGGESGGERYIVASGGSGAWSGLDDYIVEWNGSSWDSAVPTEGYAVWVEDEDVLYTYNGAAWVKFGSTVTHANLLGKDADDHTQYLLADGSRNLSGSLTVNDNVSIYWGTGSDMRAYHDGTDSRILNTTGKLLIKHTGVTPGNMAYDNNSHGYNHVFTAENDAGTDKTLLTLDPDTETATVGGTLAATTVTGANVSSGADPGHTHTAYSGTGHAHALGDLSDVTATAEGTGGGFDADTVDTLHASSFIRSNANDNVTGNTEWQDNYAASFGDSADLDIIHDGTDSIIRNSNGILYLRSQSSGGDIVFDSNSHGSHIRFDAESTGGTNYTLLKLDPDVGLWRDNEDNEIESPLFQCGRVQGHNTSPYIRAVTFDLAYSAAPKIVTCTEEDASASTGPRPSAITTTGCNMTLRYSTNWGQWFALGKKT